MSIKQIFPELDENNLDVQDIDDLTNLFFSSINEKELLELNSYYNKDDFDGDFKQFLSSKLKEAISIDEIEDESNKILEELN